MENFWQTSERVFDLSEKTLIMGILNLTPDSFSDGGKFDTLRSALRQAEKLTGEGADILDVGGESTRPKSRRVAADEEIKRVVPVIEEIKKRFPVPISVDTSKSEVALKAVEAGAEIINDISGLKFDEKIAEIARRHQSGLILMHLRGEFETMHRQTPVADVFREVAMGLRGSIEKAENQGVGKKQICLDVGIGFSKTFEQNLELIARLDEIRKEFPKSPLLIGASRKSFIGKILDEPVAEKRSNGTSAVNSIAVWNGANILRVHDVKAAVETARVVEALKKSAGAERINL